MIALDTLTVKPQQADTAMIVTGQVRFEHLRIYQSLGTWRWQHVYADGKLAQTGNEAYPTELCAARIAATVAHSHGVPAILPRALEPELASLWYQEGQDKFWGKYPIEICWNNYQRAGYLGAMEEAETERSMQPLMGD